MILEGVQLPCGLNSCPLRRTMFSSHSSIALSTALAPVARAVLEGAHWAIQRPSRPAVRRQGTTKLGSFRDLHLGVVGRGVVQTTERRMLQRAPGFTYLPFLEVQSVGSVADSFNICSRVRLKVSVHLEVLEALCLEELFIWRDICLVSHHYHPLYHVLVLRYRSKSQQMSIIVILGQGL